MSNLIDIIKDQEKWSKRQFGEGKQTEKICKHIELELQEVRETPDDLMEWVDVILLALDGAWRSGHNAYEITNAIFKKQKINREREWDVVDEGKTPALHKKGK